MKRFTDITARFTKKSGFTIVELLIVIVIIGILSTLVAVSYTGISDLARKAALSSNAQSVLRSIKVHMVENEDFNPLTLDETNVKSTLNIDATGYETLAMYNQSGENYIYIVGKDSFAGLVACGIQGSVAVYSVDDAACAFGGSAYAVDTVKDIDLAAGVLGGGNGSTCALAKTIQSIEDLVFLATSTNGGTTYSGVCVKLMVDLDFSQSRSYYNKDTTAFGDLNGNGNTEGLKTELTTGAGFVPIGNTSTNFRGTFLGEQNYIYNLMINRPATDYVGLFGYNRGTVAGVNLVDINIVGRDYVGGVAGTVLAAGQGIVTDMNISGDVTGNLYVGLAVGRLTDFTTTGYVQSVITNGNVTGSDYVGGVVGINNQSIVGAVVLGGSVTSVSSHVGRIEGNKSSGGYVNGYSLDSVVLNGSTMSSSSPDSDNGANISSLSEVTDDINTAEQVFDTYIGGDFGGDGYYWDYDGSGNLVKKNTSSNPLTFSLSGSGTLIDPYLINDYDGLKQASLRLDKIYKITSDIDLATKKFYMIGSYTNRFTGTIYGNNKTISNVVINSPKSNYIGFTGYIYGNGNSTITGLNLNNIRITGRDFVGGFVGYIWGRSSSGRVVDSTVSGSVTGRNNVGLAAGYLCYFTSAATISSVIVSGSVVGNDSVGGLVGYNNNAGNVVKGINAGGSLTSVGSNIGRASGYRNASLAESVSSVTVNGSTVSSATLASLNGKDIIISDLAAQATYTDVGFNFTDEALDYIWYIDGATAKFREGNL